MPSNPLRSHALPTELVRLPSNTLRSTLFKNFQSLPVMTKILFNTQPYHHCQLPWHFDMAIWRSSGLWNGGGGELCSSCACMLHYFNRVWLFDTLWIVVLQAPVSTRFSRPKFLEWAAMPSSGGSSWSRDETCIS